MLREQFDDTQIIARHYDSAEKWMDFMSRLRQQRPHFAGHLRRLVRAAGRPDLIHSQDPKRQTDKTLLATSYFYHDLRLMERYAKMLGKTEDARRFTIRRKK